MRFVLVANNPRVDLSPIAPTDIVVQFNHAEHFARLRHHPGPRIFVWRRNGNSTCSGWHDYAPMHDYAGDLHVSLGHHPRVEYECAERGWPYRAVNTEPPHYPRGIPSTGFWTLYVLHRMRLPVALIGWTHNGWPGHDYDHERRWVEAHGIERI
jgi:hypothetical protein